VGYNEGTIDLLASSLGMIPSGGSVLELGNQEIHAAAPLEKIKNLVRVAGGDPEIVVQKYFQSGVGQISDAFEGSSFTYRCVDLYPGNRTIVADLNTYSVPDEWRGRFDLITNHGTTEHVADQMNAFRVIHDFAAVGAICQHYVPALGFFNHGLFNYQPAFFLFLAEANDYEIMLLDVGGPHLEHTLPPSRAMPNAREWAGIIITSGILIAHLRKRRDAPFKLFSDYDVTRVNVDRRLPREWIDLMRDRYDLRIHDSK
jgi:hypothetical protein